MECPKRKRIRLPDYDYSGNGAYFITVCTQNKVKLFGEIGENTPARQMVEKVFAQVLSRYPHVDCPKYVLMPNHFHALLVIDKRDMEASATVMNVVQAFKSISTVEYIRLVKAGFAVPFEKKVWQRSFYDHIIRSERDFQEVWRYIDENPLKWKLDRFYL